MVTEKKIYNVRSKIAFLRRSLAVRHNLFNERQLRRYEAMEERLLDSFRKEECETEHIS